MSDTPFYNNFSQPQEPESCDQDSRYSPLTQDTFGLSILHGPTIAPPSVLEYEPTAAIQTRPSTLPLLQESEWEKDKVYDEDPSSDIHYFIEWWFTGNNKAVVKDIEEDIILAPAPCWN